MNPELVKFHLPTTDQFSVAVDNEVAAQRPRLITPVPVDDRHPASADRHSGRA
jgi:hypothetical protein